MSPLAAIVLSAVIPANGLAGALLAGFAATNASFSASVCFTRMASVTMLVTAPAVWLMVRRLISTRIGRRCGLIVFTPNSSVWAFTASFSPYQVAFRPFTVGKFHWPLMPLWILAPTWPITVAGVSSLI